MISETNKYINYRLIIGDNSLAFWYDGENKRKKIHMFVPPELRREEYKEKDGIFGFDSKGGSEVMIKIEELEKILIPEALEALAKERDNLPSELKYSIWGLSKILSRKPDS